MNKKIMSEEAFNELIDNVEVVSQLTLYGRKNIKYYFEKLQKENQQLKEQLQQKEDIINKAKVDLEKHLNAKSYGNHKYELFDRKYLEEVLEILNNKGSDNNE